MSQEGVDARSCSSVQVLQPRSGGVAGASSPERVAERCYVILTITWLGPWASLQLGVVERSILEKCVQACGPDLEAPRTEGASSGGSCLCSLEPPSPSPCHSGASHPVLRAWVGPEAILLRVGGSRGLMLRQPHLRVVGEGVHPAAGQAGVSSSVWPRWATQSSQVP